MANANILELMQYVQQQGEKGTATRKQNALAQLTGDYAAGAAPDYAAIARNGGNPMKFRDDARQQEDALRASLGRDAAMLLAAPPGQREALYQQNLPKYRHFFQAAPPSYTPALDPILAQLAGGEHGKPISLAPGGVLVGPDGREIYRNENFAPQRPFYDPERGIMVYPGQAAGGGGGGTPGIPPQGNSTAVAATAEYMAAHGVPDSAIEAWIAQQPGMTPVAESGARTVQVAPPKPQKPDYEGERLELARQAAARADQAAQEAAAARRRAERGNAPPGYRFNAKDELERIPGAPQAIGKPLPAPVVNKLTKAAGVYDNTDDLLTRFQDNYAGNLVGGSIENFAGRHGAEHIPLVGATPGQAEWWQQYDRQRNVVRNELFGSALTPSEQRAFAAADIDPNMAPDVIRANLNTQKTLISRALDRQSKVWKAQGFNVEAIDAATMPAEAAGAADFSHLWNKP